MIGDASHACVASALATSLARACAGSRRVRRSANAARRSAVTSLRQASVNAGSVASASAAMATSTSGYRWKSWKLLFVKRSTAVMLMSRVPGRTRGREVR